MICEKDRKLVWRYGILASLLLLFLVSVAKRKSYGGTEKNLMEQGQFTYEIQTDSKTGWPIYVLRYSDSMVSQNNLEVRVVPELGSNLFSLKSGETELLVNPKDLAVQRGIQFGIPILFPTPNRVRESRFTFNGQTFSFPPNERTHFIHGLVHNIKWEAGTPSLTDEAVSLKTWLDWSPSLPDYELFPIKHRLSMSYLLSRKGVKLQFTVENLDQKPLPFGFGLHPWFRILGERAKTFLAVPAKKHMEAEGLLPTGKLEGLDGSPYDLREPVSLAKLDLDDVFWGLTPGNPAWYEATDKGLKVKFLASEEFTHMVVYTPQGKPYFCMENQTCSTDAHNLHAKGFREEAHLSVVESGKQMTGWVEFLIERKP